MRSLIEIALEPKSKASAHKLALMLSSLAAEDLTFGVTVDPDSGQIIIKGVSEGHVGGLVERIRRQIDVNVGHPQIAYVETISKVAEIDYTYKKQLGGSAQYARVKLRFEPLPTGSGYQFANEVVGGSVPNEYIPGVIKGLKASIENGVIAGFPVTDLKVILCGGAYRDADSSVLAFEVAARAAMREGLLKAVPALLEPIMKIAVATPEECVDDVVVDLKSRRGEEGAVGKNSEACAILATVPLANLFGYDEALSSLSHGRATFAMDFSHYAVVPSIITDDEPDRPAGSAAMGVA